ncbi:hypothetical protein [Ottowia sp.]|uniref:hypothetical protein n=1 Tax=Ottowia sp. TaxID=1898956 RepID=UPI003A846419
MVALLFFAFVFGLLYPTPYRALLGVESVFLLVLVVDVVCGPLLTLILANPRKSRHERWLDFGLVGLIQTLALAYGLYSVWIARPVVLAFEVDRFVVVTANEVDVAALPKAPQNMRSLPFFGVRQVGTRAPDNSDEMLKSLEQQLGGLTPAMQPDWWVPWQDKIQDMKARAKPLSELMARRPQDAQALREAANAAKADPAKLFYLPLTSSKVKEWVALLDADMKIVGYAPVDGF